MKCSRLLLSLCLVAALALSACGSNDDTSSANKGGGDGASSTQATGAGGDAAVTPPPTEPPAQIQVDEPLPKAPPKGKSVIFLQCEFPSCARYKAGMESATQALGWKLQTRVFKNNGEGPAGAMDQAVAQKPDYIAISGIPVAAMKPQLAKAAAAGIKVVSASDPERPAKGTWLAQIGGTLQPDAENVTRWMINDAQGKANILAVTIPQFPSLGTETSWMKKEIPSMCSGCTYHQLDVTVDEVGAGAVPQKLVGYLQSHPDINYVFFTFSDLGKTVGKVLKGAGLRDKVKLTGCCGDAGNAKEIESGDTDAWTISPNEYSAFAMVDAMARDAAGMDLTQSNDKVWESPSWVVASADAVDSNLKPSGYDWHGPADFESQFKKLWNVG